LIAIKKYQLSIEEQLKTLSAPGHPVELYAPVEYIVSLGGKRIRPVLVLAACELFDGKHSDALPAAVAIEMFHNFTLVHDDIMDKAPLRRGKTTVHEKWNDNTAILSGDVMLVKAYLELSKIDPLKLPVVLEVFSKTAIEVCEGQQLDMNYESREVISIAMYLEMIGLKTAALIAASLQLGALAGGARAEDAARMYDFGKNLGMAFQLQDDILDVYGDEKKFGKQKGGDIISNKKTFLLLKAMELSAGKPELEKELSEWLRVAGAEMEKKVGAVTAIYNRLGIRAMAENEMTRYYQEALKNLHDIPLTQNKKKDLIDFVDSLIVREN